MNQKIKFGIVGIGHIGVRHAQCVLDNPRATLSAMCDIVEEKYLKIDVGDAVFFTDFQEFLSQELDVINICTPNYLHSKMAIDALNSKKHVIIEKPMALCTNDAQEIMDVAKRNKKSVFGVMQNRFSPTVVWLRKMIQQFALGDINLILVNCFWNRNSNYYLNSDWHGSLIKDGGPLFTQFSHFIDIINWIFGDFYSISAEFNSFRKKEYVEFEDSGIINFTLKNPQSLSNTIRSTLTYTTSVWNKNFESSITVIGERGTIKIGGQYMDKISYCDIKDYDKPNVNINTQCNDYGDYTGSASNHDKMIQTVIDQLMFNKQNSHFLSSQDGVDVVNIIERIYSLRK